MTAATRTKSERCQSDCPRSRGAASECRCRAVRKPGRPARAGRSYPR
jgi:hypothetical protein